MSFTLINDQAGLSRMMENIAGERTIAFDIECASNLHHYINRVCLMQLFVKGQAFVIDALGSFDLAPIGRLLEDPSIEIVMHDTDFDLRSLDRDYAWHPHNLFDTLIAARLCGRREFGLSALLSQNFGIGGSKKFQRADWTIRPLPGDMLEYAASDVIHLLRLRDLLADELAKLGRMEWAREEFKLCESKRFELDDRPLFARVKKARETCDGRDLAVLKELAEVRNEIAKALDLPPFMVMGDEALIALAKRPPKSVEDLASRRSMHPVCRRGYAKRIVDAAHAGLSAPKLKWPRPRRGERHAGFSHDTLDKLKAWRTKYASEVDVEPDLILSMDSLRRIAAGEPIDKVMQREPVRIWRGDEIGKALREVISKDGQGR